MPLNNSKEKSEMKITKTQLKEHIHKIIREQLGRYKSKPDDLDDWSKDPDEDYWRAEDYRDPDLKKDRLDRYFEDEDDSWDTELYPKGKKIKEYVRKVVRQYLNEGDSWRDARDEAAGRGFGGGSWRDNYPRGGDDEYLPRRRASRYESDEERLERQSREMQDQEKNKMLKQLKLDPSLKDDKAWRQDFFNAGGWWDDLGMDAP